MTVAFRQPFVAEALGSGFDKPQSEKFFMLRHPRIKKIDLDCSWQDTVCLEELSRMTDEARKVPAVSKELDGAAQKVALQIAKFERTYSASQQTTQESSSSLTTRESKNPRSGRKFAGIPPVIIRVDTKELMELSKQAGPLPAPPISSLDGASHGYRVSVASKCQRLLLLPKEQSCRRR